MISNLTQSQVKDVHMGLNQPELEYQKPPKPNRPLRVLFLHATRDESNEYKVHKNLAENVDPDYVDAMFLWQSATHDPSANVFPQLARENRVFHYDFGRNMNLPQRPSHLQRGMMVVGRTPGAFLKIRKHIREFKPDVIYTTQQHHEVFLAHQASRLFNIPHVIHICYEVGPWLGKNTLNIIQNNDHVIGSCKFVQETAIGQGVPRENTEHIHHIADTRIYDIPHNGDKLRKELDLPLDTPIITSAARLDDGKGFPLLLEAFSKVLPAVPNARLLIVGDASAGTDFDQVIYNKAKELDLGDKVRFLGFRDDLPEIFAGTDIFALPLLADAVSLVFLGAMVARIPCVSIDSGSVPEVVLHDKTGFVSKPGDPDQLAANIVKLINNPDLAKEMGEAGRVYALNHFSAENISNWWLDILFRRFGHLTQ